MAKAGGGTIRLSEQHGVNPSMGVCFWCGKEDGTILLLGRLPGDKEAPRRMVAGYEPCDECKAQFALGAVLIEAKDRPSFDGQQPIQKAMMGNPDLYPTGRLHVIKREAVARIFNPESMVQEVLRLGQAFIEPEVFDAIEDARKRAEGG